MTTKRQLSIPGIVDPETRQEFAAMVNGMTRTGAFFSPCRVWRYALFRDWDMTAGAKRLAVCGLNPSTADETNDDPTIRRCIGFAKRWGYGGLVMLNLFGYRATYPKDMKAAADPVGPGNDAAILEWSGRCAETLAAWGTHGGFAGRDRAVIELLRGSGKRMLCLGFTKHGYPLHPLFVPAKVDPVLFS